MCQLHCCIFMKHREREDMMKIAGCRPSDGGKARKRWWIWVFLQSLWQNCYECLYIYCSTDGECARASSATACRTSNFQTLHFQSQWGVFWQHPSKKFSLAYWRVIVFHVRMMHLMVYTHIPTSRLCDKKRINCCGQRFCRGNSSIWQSWKVAMTFLGGQRIQRDNSVVELLSLLLQKFCFLRNNFLLRWPDFS